MPDLIYNQRKIPEDQWRYGLRSSADTGCGWIATWNALVLLGYTAEIPELIHYYEWQLPLIHGNLGTMFWGPYLCFRQWGFPVRLLGSVKDYDRAAKEADVSILFYHWRKGARLGAHFVALRPTDRGFVGYNVFKNSVGPDFLGESLEEFIRKQKYFGTFLIPIRKKA